MIDFKTSLLGLALFPVSIALASCSASEPAKTPSEHAPAGAVSIQRFTAPVDGIFANAYLLQGKAGLVIVDATLRNSDAQGLLEQATRTSQPLLGLILTHGHPDHYNGLSTLAAGRDIPIYSTAGVAEVVRRDDAAKEAQWRPVFGAEWPVERRFPDHLVGDGQAIRMGDVELTSFAFGPAESHQDSVWVLVTPERRHVFVGDLVFNGMHSYMSDGHTGPWLAALDRLEHEFSDAVLYPGHGEPGGVELIGQQRRYLTLYRETVQSLRQGKAELSAADKATLVTVMKGHLNTERLQFLIELGADAVAAELAREGE